MMLGSLKRNISQASMLACLLAPFLTMAVGTELAFGSAGSTQIGAERLDMVNPCGSPLIEFRSSPSLTSLEKPSWQSKNGVEAKKYSCLDDLTSDGGNICIGSADFEVAGMAQGPAPDVPPSKFLPHAAFVLAEMGERLDRRSAWGFNVVIWAAVLASFSSMAYADVSKSISSRRRSRSHRQVDAFAPKRTRRRISVT